MKSMDTWRQRCAVVVGLTVALVLTLTPAGAAKPKPADDDTVMDLRFAGIIINALQYIEPSTGQSSSGAFGQFKHVGSPGSGETTLFDGQADNPIFNLDCCDGPAGCLSIHITENPLVLTFNDLSLLFATSAPTGGDICVDLFTGRSTATIDIIFIGGRGRFAGATGEAVIVAETEPVSSDGSLSGETGTIVGTIVLP